jgi:hypothetical protein
MKEYPRWVKISLVAYLTFLLFTVWAGFMLGVLHAELNSGITSYRVLWSFSVPITPFVFIMCTWFFVPFITSIVLTQHVFSGRSIRWVNLVQRHRKKLNIALAGFVRKQEEVNT